MPFAVSQWPYSPDPRTTDFDIPGWNHGQVAPFKWILSTTGATGIYEFYNDGALQFKCGEGSGVTVFCGNPVGPAEVDAIIQIFGFDPPLVGPPEVSKRIFVEVRSFSTNGYVGTLDQLYPIAIKVQQPIVMVEDTPFAGTIPNPMVMTPAKWNATQP